MKVKVIKTNATIDVNESYGARLIEQGKAVSVRSASREAESRTQAPPAQSSAEAKKSGQKKAGKDE